MQLQSPLKLWVIRWGPYPRRVLLYLKIKGVPNEDIEIVNMEFTATGGMSGDPDKPAGSVPMLQLEDGSLIRQSMGILQYLEERFAHIGSNMSGTSALERAQIRDMCSLVDEAAAQTHVYMSHASKIFTRLNPHQSKVEAERSEALRDKALRTLADWTSDTRGFLMGGENPTLPDIVLFALMQSYRVFYGDDIGKSMPRLEDFYNKMSGLDGTEAPEYPAHMESIAKQRVVEL
ncbi:hypothetical protein CYLTODRAFT_412947 [Cylindrobasidium torrendii FP15055 ss-10]|uniref:Glutathione S-transferase n=1 Tax=Cylindrobasidium torrendii FP15055 ss-10 TaxID=1314674 RepID=A0A0D7B414_9AGAR|nr:hypothetical protein CYLTODRAFT_412947 [Cylindrobasidium torrendii FP15055 ss-10]